MAGKLSRIFQKVETVKKSKITEGDNFLCKKTVWVAANAAELSSAQ